MSMLVTIMRRNQSSLLLSPRITINLFLMSSVPHVTECAIQVLFEAVLDSARSGEMEWTICDIDDWLEGNEFWNLTKSKRAK
jgi:hypothetical protein